MEQITKNVFIENGVRGANLGFVVTSKGVVLIETPVDLEYAKGWAKEIGKWGVVRYIINTEHHLDHWLHNSFFAGEIVAHQAARDIMVGMDLAFIRKRIAVNYIDPLPIPDEHQLRLPTITYSERMTLYLDSHTFHLIYTPGHTIGETTVYIPEEKIIFTGDNVFGQRRTAIHQAYLDKWLDSLKIIEKLDANIIVPGHGKICDKESISVQSSIIKGLLETSKKTEGWTIDESVRRKIDPFYETRDIGLKP